ncbi:DUF3019 domain-containing protein [Rheinheimera sp.]|uniref:DUF3019 domain-containing protein n=1 Tax=Rheinheimera sp. TaxID=1869214 RepID=UPI00307FA560
MMVRPGILMFTVPTLLFPLAVRAQTQLQLQLVPHICVVTEREPECNTEVKLLITGGEPQEVCVLDHDNRPDCRQHQPPAQTEINLQIHTKTNLAVQVTSRQGQPLAKTQLQLVQFQGALKRHKRGYLWNML